MKGKTQKGVKADQTLNSSFYAGGGSNVASEAKSKAEGFKRGGKTMKAMGEKAKMNAGRKPRKSGGGVMSTAARGQMRPGFEG
jgi:hypothetical protein